MLEVLRLISDNRGAGNGAKDLARLRVQMVEPEVRLREPLFDGEPEERHGFAIDEIALRSVDLAAPKHNLSRLDQFTHALLTAVEFGRLSRKATVDQRGQDRDGEDDRCDADDSGDTERRNF